MKRSVDTDPIYREEPDLREIPPRFMETDEGKYVIYLSDFYDFDAPNYETAEVERDVLIALLRSKRLEKRIEIRDYRHRVPFHFDEMKLPLWRVFMSSRQMRHACVILKMLRYTKPSSPCSRHSGEDVSCTILRDYRLKRSLFWSMSHRRRCGSALTGRSFSSGNCWQILMNPKHKNVA